jgi:predicted dehydrogenase
LLDRTGGHQGVAERGNVVDKLRIAVVGCGAVAERVHLPALALSPHAEVRMLVDRSLERAQKMARTFGVGRVATDYREAIGQVDAAIVGVPHQYHAPIAVDLLDAGVHVLVEKPMALTAADCMRMNEAADRSGSVLTVGLLRRCSPALRWVHDAIAGGAIGDIESFDIREGSVYRWPVASPSTFQAGGGVLADAGSHVLDLIVWWFGGWRSVLYRDDARGGVEADCLLEIEMANGAHGRIELSRTREMANLCIVTGERGTIEVGTKSDATIAVRWRGEDTLLGRASAAGAPGPTNVVDLFLPQFDGFVNAIRTGEPPIVTGIEAMQSVELLMQCYASREPWVLPWDASPRRTIPPAVAMSAVFP